MRSVVHGGVLVRLAQGDITDQAVDAIVNAANASLLGGGGVDGAIHRRGGPEILEECRVLRSTLYPDGLPTGEAVLTTAGALPARHVIHTVGPVWHGGERREASLLARAYASSLRRARDAGLESIAFPSISTGAYGYPVAAAAEIATQTVLAEVAGAPGTLREVVFVLFGAGDFRAYELALERAAASTS
jgi:O-acetyl-ADP-ribose deacetylase (regulator of RNase III)